MKYGYVYIMTNKFNRVLYTGVSSDLKRRVYQHKHKYTQGFAQRYNLNKLVYYEVSDGIRGAIEREKQIKNYSRKKKIALVETMNPGWDDLYDGI